MKSKHIILLSLSIVLLVSILSCIWLLDIPNWQYLDTDKILNTKLNTVIYDTDNETAFNMPGNSERKYVSFDTIPDHVYQAFIAAEDQRFYSHNGIDFRRIFGAVMANIRSLSYSQGASTITQQLIKLTHLSSEKTLARKAQEAYLAYKLEKVWSKDEILEAYINTVYFGGGAYGIEAAAMRYYSKPASELSVEEAALLAGIIKAPSSYAPHIDPDAALSRRNYVLSAMAEAGFISDDEYAAAFSSDITLSETIFEDDFSWYRDQVCLEACDILQTDIDSLMSGGYTIYTAYDPIMQNAAETVMASDDYYPDLSAEGALAAIDPSTGEIIALTGGKSNSSHFGFNRAVSARRQPGSLIKPISTYAAAVEKHGYLPTTFVYDVQREYSGGYMPGNSGGVFHGKVTLRYALSKSLNAATVDLADTVGIDSIASMLGKFGIDIEKNDYNLALSLGAMTHGVSPVKMCAAYAALANEGMYNTPHCIRRIVDKNGNVIYEYNSVPTKALSRESAFIITDMLKTAVTEGTAKALSTISVPAAAKTGTAGLDNGDTSDAWAAAYTPDIAVTVWIGKDNNSGGGMAASVTGGGYAAPACASFLRAVTDELSGKDFQMPETLSKVLTDQYALENESRLLLAAENTPSKYAGYEIAYADTVLPQSDIWNIPPPVTDLQLVESENSFPTLKFTGTGSYSEYILVRKTRGISEIAAVLQCASGETLIYSDTGADPAEINTYAVIPRHALLYAESITLTGSASNTVQYSPDGLLNSISSLFDKDTGSHDIESITKPLF